VVELKPEVREDDVGGASLTLSGENQLTQAVFEKHGWDGNGYDWGEVGQALALMKMPERASQLFFDPEGEYLLVLGPNRAVMDELAGWLWMAIEYPELLEEAMRVAEEHGFDGCTHG
jgi:hypothetical protein